MNHHKFNHIDNMLLNIIEAGEDVIFADIEKEKKPFKRTVKREMFYIPILLKKVLSFHLYFIKMQYSSYM